MNEALTENRNVVHSQGLHLGEDRLSRNNRVDCVVDDLVFCDVGIYE